MSSDQSRGFDLVSQPWIRTRTGEQVDERSLEDTFASAHQIEALAGELPTQSAAVLRLLLAILRRSLPYARTRAQAEGQWRDLWEAEALPMQEIRAYLDQHRGRFDLLSSTTPFMQVAGLAANTKSGLGSLVADMPRKERALFTTRSGEGLSSMTFSEAARWIVHVQAYDTSGIKTGAHGDDRAKGGRGSAGAPGWTGRLGLIVVAGSSLKETLLLNLPLDHPSLDDFPVWERPPQTAAVEADHAFPTGPVDLMTWQSRRIVLFCDGSDVKNAQVSNGDPIKDPDQHIYEDMTGWKRVQSRTQRRGGNAEYVPMKHDAEMAMWRGLTGLLVQRVRGGPVSGDGDDVLPPRSLDWLATMQEQGFLQRDFPVHVSAIGMIYGTPKPSTIKAVVDDSLRLRLSVLTDSRLYQLVIESLAGADGAVEALSHLAGDLALARGQKADAARANARADGYLRLDRGYRLWLSSLRSDSDLTERRTAWQRFAKDAIRRLGDELVLDAGDDAFRGRDVERRGGGTRHVSSGNALLWFTRSLAKALPLATARPSETSEKELTHG